MNIKKAELRFKREWAKATSGKAAPHVRVLPVAEEDQDKADLILQFDVLATSAIEAYVSATGCQSLGSMGMAMLVKVPAEWLAAPTRLMFAATGQERLHNALLNAGIADWLDIHLTTDQAALEVEFIEHPTAEQIAALKHDYDVLTFEELTYTFVERTAAPLVDPAKVEAKVRQCWAGGHGGKIASIEPTADPREWIVTTVKPVPANAQLRNHGLALVKQIAPEVSHVRITDDLWSKLLQKPAPTPETTATTEAAIVADTDTQPIPEPAPESAPLPEPDERDLELNALKAQVENLHGIIRSLTPLTNEWQTLTLKVKRDGTGITAHPEITEQEALGWRVHHVQYAPNGEDRLFVFMDRRAQTQRETARHYAVGGYVAANAQSFEEFYNSNRNPVFQSNITIPLNGNMGQTFEDSITSVVSNRLADAMIKAMDDEIAPSAQALRNAFYPTGTFNDN